VYYTNYYKLLLTKYYKLLTLGTSGFIYIQKSSASLPSGFECTWLDDVSGVRRSDGRHRRRARCRAWPPTCPQRCRLGSSLIPLRRPPPPSYLHAASRRSRRRRHHCQRVVDFSLSLRSRPPPTDLSRMSTLRWWDKFVTYVTIG
jgi:hypothetical protein